MKLSRRGFLKSSIALGVGSTTSIKYSLANSLTNDYKALVGVFLFGGNDAYNMVVPQGGGAYEDYYQARPKIALASQSLIDTGLTSQNGVALGLHPAMASLSSVFSRDKATIIVNSGQLVEPRVGKPNAALPEFLMAHNLQQEMWQSGTENMSDKLGWAGKLLDMVGGSSTLSSAISISGEQKWLRSTNQGSLLIPKHGPSNYNGFVENLDEMLNQSDFSYDNLIKDYYAKTIRSKYSENMFLQDTLSNDTGTNITYPETDLATQLQQVAKLIRSRHELGHQKQIFMVGIGGFDTHHSQNSKHHDLLAQVSQALASFQEDMEQSNIDEKVTTFTMSDFGRRIMANDTGTDHGWAGHQIVMGGAVKGSLSNNGVAYGNWPDLKAGSDYDYNNGRIIPEIAADQVNATLAKWFLGGSSPEKITELFPSLVNFKGAETLAFL